jgi:hypothetical protein
VVTLVAIIRRHRLLTVLLQPVTWPTVSSYEVEVGAPSAFFNFGHADSPVFLAFFDVTRDGQRFLVAPSVGANSRPALTPGERVTDSAN